MAHLFKNKKIREELERYEIPDLEGKIEKVKAWYDSYKNKSLHAKTESQCEQAFNQHFFIEILGYTSFPNETYTIDPKGTADASSQKADAILGHFSEDQQRVTAAVEIKDVNTSLDKSQQRAGNMSPIQQAFKYKPQYKGCAFVIATNFFEIRLFRDNQLDYELFTLETLMDPKDNYYEFRKFYYLLNAENFVIKHGKSVTEKLLSEIRIEQEKITKEFYRDYKDLRQSLINNLIKNKKDLDFDIAIEKAQKIIDRIVFISFCEDIDLLPENKLQEVVFHTEKMGLEIPVWDIMKGFFKAIDKGSKKLEIPHGYNGELFKEDIVLDGLFIDDALCKRFVEFGKYDFSEDLSVNILGHIFEQSISDIEELKAFIEEKETDKKKSKRKKDGIFYTPDYIVDYMVKNSLGSYLEEKEKDIMKKHGLKEEIKGKNYEKRALKVYDEYQEVLRDVKVLDPACGSGAFLVKVFDYLLAENKRVADVLAELSGGNKNLFSDEGYIKDLLENNIYGVDLNPESVEITKLSLWLKTAMRGKKLVSLKNNIKCGNSLIDDPEVAGDRAFKWEEEFKEIMDGGGFDVVVGNPPYVRADSSGNDEILRLFLQGSNKFKNLSGKWDLYIPFIELAIILQKEDGKSSLIIPDAFCHANYSQKLIDWLEDKHYLKELDYFPNTDIFEGVGVKSVILTCSKNKCFSFVQKMHEDTPENYKTTIHEKYPESLRFDFKPKLIKVENNKHKRLEEICYISVGIVGNSDEKKYKGEFIVGDLLSGKKDEIHCRRYIEGKDLDSWIIKNKRWIEYGTERSPKKWRRKAFSELFESGDKLITMRSPGKEPRTIFTNEEMLFNESAIGFRKWSDFIEVDNASLKKSYIDKENRSHLEKISSNFSLKYILAILNSSLIKYELNSKRRSNIHVYPDDWKGIPIAKLSKKDQEGFVEKTDLMLLLSKEFYEKLQKFLDLIKSEFGIEKISKKLESFYELNFDEFVENLKLKKLSLDKKEELLNFFKKHKEELIEVKDKMDITDKKIDEMVLDLYGLSEEERGVVLGN